MSTSDFNKPSLTDKYSDVLPELNSKSNDLARGLASDAVDANNLPEKSIRWNAGNKFWERLVGGAWAALADVYNITVSRAKVADSSDACSGNAATASDVKKGSKLETYINNFNSNFSNLSSLVKGCIEDVVNSSGFLVVSAGNNGAIAFPTWLGGLIIQWGTYSASIWTPGIYTTNVMLPIAYRSGYTGMASIQNVTLPVAYSNATSVKITNTTLGVTFTSNANYATPASQPFAWITFGF
jgi:hypothetical protein